PGQQVAITLSNIGPTTRLALFKDLKADLKTLLSSTGTPDLRQIDASMNGPSGANWDTSPWGSSPWGSSPWGSSPWGSSPWGSSPADAKQLCASLQLTVPNDTCSGGYLTVQMQDLLAWSANGQITKNTFDLSGDFYIRIYNDDGSFDTSRTITITALVIGT